MGGKARWRKLRRVVGVEPLGCHAPSRQRFKQDRAKTRDAKITRDQARAEGVEGVEVDVLERMGVSALAEGKKASRLKRDDTSLDKIEVEFHEVAVNGTINVHVRADVDDEATGVNGQVDLTDNKDDYNPPLLERHDQEGDIKDHDTFIDTEISKPAIDNFSDDHFSFQDDESKKTDQNQTSSTKMVHFSAEPASIIGDDDKDDDESATDRTVTPSPCSSGIEDIKEEEQCEGQDEVQTGEGVEDDDSGRLETIEECQKETYDEVNQELVLESQDLMTVRDNQEIDHQKDIFTLCLNATTVVIDGFGNCSVEDTNMLMPSPEELEKSQSDGNEVQEFCPGYSFPEPLVLDEDGTRIQVDLRNTALDKAEQETPFTKTSENMSEEHVHEEGTILGDESEIPMSSERYYNFKELNITDKPDTFLQSEDNEESVSIYNDEVRFTVAPRHDSDILDDSSPDYCASRNLSMEVNATESVKFFLSDSELSDNEYQTKNTYSDSNDMIQPEDWVDRMDEDEHNECENADRQDETDDTIDIVIYDLDDTDDEVPSQMDEEDEQNKTLDEEEEKLKDTDEKKEYDTDEVGERRWEVRSPDLEAGERCVTPPMHNSVSNYQNLAEDTDPPQSVGDEYNPPEIIKSSMENNKNANDGSLLYRDDWEAILHKNQWGKTSYVSEQSKPSIAAEKQISVENKQCIIKEPEIIVSMQHWEARRQRRKLVQCCAVLDEQVFAAYRKNFTPSPLRYSAVRKYPVLYKETYENDQQYSISTSQNSAENSNYSTLGIKEFEKQEMTSVVEDRTSLVTKEQYGIKDQQFSTIKGRDSEGTQQNSLIEHQYLENQEFLKTRKRTSTDYQNALEEEQSPQVHQQYMVMEEEESLEKYQPSQERSWNVKGDLQNPVVKEQHSEVYQPCLITRKRNSLESQQIYRVGEQHSEDQEAPPIKRRNSMEDQRMSVMERQSSREDKLFPEISKQLSTEKCDLEKGRQSWEWDQQLPETKRQSSVEIQQSLMMERKEITAYKESPRPMRQTSMEEQKMLQTEKQDLQEYQQFLGIERRNSIEKLEKTVQETKDLPENLEEYPITKSCLTSHDKVAKDQTSVEDKQYSLLVGDQYGEIRTSFQEDRTSHEQTLEYAHHSEEKRLAPIDDLLSPKMNMSNLETERNKSEKNNQYPDNQEHSAMNRVIIDNAEPAAIDSANIAEHHQYGVSDMQNSTNEGLYPNMGIKNLDYDLPCLSKSRQDSLENPKSISRQISSENPRSMDRQDSSKSPRPMSRQDSSENPRSMNKQDPSQNPTSVNRQYSVDDDYNPVMSTELSEDGQFDSMEGKVLKADEQYPVLQRQYAVEDQQRPLLQRQSSVESEQYSVVDGLKIRDSFDLYDQKISSPTIDSAYGDRLSLPRDSEGHYKYITESTSPTARVSKIGMPFSIVDTFDFDTNEDKNLSKEETETSTPIHDQSDPVERNYHFAQTCQDNNIIKSGTDEAYLDSGNRVAGVFEERMVDELTNRMKHCQINDPQEDDANNDENGSYFNTPPSFYPYSSPTPSQLVPRASEDLDNLQYKTFGSRDTLNQYSTSPSKAGVKITDSQYEENLNEYVFLPKDEEKHKEKNFDELPEKGKESSPLAKEFQSIPSFDNTYSESSSDVTTAALHTKDYQSLDNQEHVHTRQEIVDSSVVKDDPEGTEVKKEYPDTIFPSNLAKPNENPEAILVSQDIVMTERTASSIPSPLNAERSVLLSLSKIDDGKLLSKRRRQRRRTKSTTSSDGESQVFLDFTDGSFTHKGESSAKSANSAESTTRDGLTSIDTKVLQDDIKEFQSSNATQGEIESPVEAFTFAHNPEKSADLDQQSKKRFQKSTKKSKSRRKSDPRELVSSLSLDGDKDMAISIKGSPGSAKLAMHHSEESPSLFPGQRENQKEEVSGTLGKFTHATAAGLCKETDKSAKQRQGSPMVKRKPRGYELKRSSSMKTYIREINEESIKSETLASDLSRGLEASSEPTPAPRQYIPPTMSSSMPSQLPQPSVHAPRTLFTDNLDVRSSTPPNVGQDQMHTPGYPRSVLRPPAHSRKLPAPTAHPPTFFLEPPRGLQGTTYTSQEDSANLDSNRNRQPSPNVNTQKHIDHQFSSLNRSRMTTADMCNTSVAPSHTGTESPQQQQQFHAPEDQNSSRPSPTTIEATGAKKMRRRRRR